MIQLYDQLTTEREILTVTQLNRLSRALLEDAFANIWVEGEISNLSQPSSGHIYFSLKDAKAQIRCAFFRNRQMHLPFTLEDGQHVCVRAKVSLYEGRGDYQLIVESVELGGDGALLKAFEQLKLKLEKQGLFAASAKRPIPAFPRCLGVITSPTGAAIKDILSVLHRRFPLLPVIIYPAQVQGDKAANELIAAIELANQHCQCDVLLLSRGGGSLEDLWCFNDEKLAHAIAGSKIPIVTGIGHEIDFTIADFVADYRAPTPSAAAEFISPNQIEIFSKLHQLTQKLFDKTQQTLQTHAQELHHLSKRLPHPQDRLLQMLQQCDYLELNLIKAIKAQLSKFTANLNQTTITLLHLNPNQKISIKLNQVKHLQEKLNVFVLEQIADKKSQLNLMLEKLDLASPLKTLARGYSITQDKKTKSLITNQKQVTPDQEIVITLKKGMINARVIEK
ncbi:MAG: exodeoxyribonuclease VII large subunit [Pseudomonadota bacterium]